jgi:hypothetical protein
MPEHVLPCKEKSAAVIPVRNELPNIFGGLTINSQSGSVLVLLLVIGKEMPHIIFFCALRRHEGGGYETPAAVRFAAIEKTRLRNEEH